MAKKHPAKSTGKMSKVEMKSVPKVPKMVAK